MQRPDPPAAFVPSYPPSEYEIVYWPTRKACATYDTREEADAALRWYVKTYGPFETDAIGVREVVHVVA